MFRCQLPVVTPLRRLRRVTTGFIPGPEEVGPREVFARFVKPAIVQRQRPFEEEPRRDDETGWCLCLQLAEARELLFREDAVAGKRPERAGVAQMGGADA